MSKKKKNGGFVKGLCIGLIAILLCGGIGFGVYKLVDHYKTTDTEQTEQTPEDGATDENTEQTPEEEIVETATANI